MTRVWFALLLAMAAPAPAADPIDPALQGPPVIEGVPPGPAPAAEAVDAITHEIALGLRCPVCQGLSVADSTSSAAVMMQRRIRDFVAAGYAREDIEDYFVSKYGEWVLLKPRTDGLNRVVWLGPLLAFGLGLGAAFTFLRRGAEATAPPASPPAPDDPYARQLLSEVDDD